MASEVRFHLVASHPTADVRFRNQVKINNIRHWRTYFFMLVSMHGNY